MIMMKELFLLCLACPVMIAEAYRMPFWFPLMTTDALKVGVPKGATFMGQELVAYRKNNSRLVVHTDVCPHMGASFSKGGWISKDKQYLHCPYHGFGFDEGRFASIPSSNKPCPKNSVMRLFNVLEKNGYCYVSPIGAIEPLEQPYFPPEHNDPNFVRITGTRLLDCPTEALVENLLDMLHISYVHSFGNMDIPLARNIRYQDVGRYGGKTMFEYSPNANTISRRVGGADVVQVENEFYLPTTTLTRVKAGRITKTVFTQSLPVSANKTLLFWTVYRNFWKDPYFSGFTSIGDYLLGTMMEKTIDEDKSILSRCDPRGRDGFLTKYDITIRNYRRKSAEFEEAFNSAP